MIQNLHQRNSVHNTHLKGCKYSQVVTAGHPRTHLKL